MMINANSKKKNSFAKIIFLFLFITIVATIVSLACVKFIPNTMSFVQFEQVNTQTNLFNQFVFHKREFNNTASTAKKTTREFVTNFSRMYAKSLQSPLYESPFPHIEADEKRQQAVKEAFMHGWKHYSEKCYGKDEYFPLTNSCGNIFGGGLMIIDSLSTLIIMDLKDEFEKAKSFILNDFTLSGSWSLFEFIIRILGGLLSAAELTGDQELIDKAISVGNAVYEPISNANGFYNSLCRFSVDKNKKYSIHCNNGGYNLAEVGTFQLEFFTLSKLTKDPKFISLALKVYHSLWSNQQNALISSHLGGGTDSYYEYITKGYAMTGGICDEMLQRHIKLMKEIRSQLVFTTTQNHLVGHGIRNGNKPTPVIEHLATFVGGMVALGTFKNNPERGEDLKLASEFVKTYAETYNYFKSGIMPEQVEYNTNPKSQKAEIRMIIDDYILRPETVESIYYLWKFTGLKQYRDYNWRIFKAINRTCRVENGFTSITKLDQQDPEHRNKQESFFYAETLKYLYLTFSDSNLISPTEWVFNTEAHPLRIWDQDTINKFKDLFEFENSERLKREDK